MVRLVCEVKLQRLFAVSLKFFRRTAFVFLEKFAEVRYSIGLRWVSRWVVRHLPVSGGVDLAAAMSCPGDGGGGVTFGLARKNGVASAATFAASRSWGCSQGQARFDFREAKRREGFAGVLGQATTAVWWKLFFSPFLLTLLLLLLCVTLRHCYVTLRVRSA